jgi:adenosine deaminase
LEPRFAAELAKKYQIHLPTHVERDGYLFSGFAEFLTLYDQIGHVIRSAEDLRRLALSYLRNVATTGTRYVEFMISPGHSIENGIAFQSQVSAISDAIDQAQAECGVLASIITTCVRHRGPTEAVEVAEMAASAQGKYVTGFGLTGNEHLYNAEDFQGAFLIAEGAGLKLTAHAGEWRSASSVLETVVALNLSGVGHGISIIDDEEALAEMVERGIGFEVCLSSNVVLGASKDYGSHPARKMIEAGCRVAFATDDPSYFRTNPRREMLLAIESFGLSVDDQTRIFKDSVAMAFCDDDTKAMLLRQGHVT